MTDPSRRGHMHFRPAAALATAGIVLALATPGFADTSQPVLVAGPPGTDAIAKCYRNLLCLHFAESGDGVDYWVEALTDTPLTFKLRTSYKNMRTATRDKAFVLERRGVTHLARLRAKRGAWEYNFRYTYHPGRPGDAQPDDTVYQLPLPKGRVFKVIQGYNGSYTHKRKDAYSIDWDMPVGTGVYAARGGIVVGAGGNSRSRKRGRGNFVWIQHSDGTVAWYLHFKHGGVRVNRAQQVNAGDLIGLSGNTGKSDGPHLHFQVSMATTGTYAYRTIPIRIQTAGGIFKDFRTGDRHLRN